MSEDEAMKTFADQLFHYLRPKIQAMPELRGAVRYFRAQVTANGGNGTLTVRRPLDTSPLTLPCTNAIAGADVGDQVTVFVLGDLSNAVVVSDGKLSTL